MNRLNNKLLSVFLSFGILFFIGLLYLFVKDEIVPSVKKEKSDLTHRLVINKINIVKNAYFDVQLNKSLDMDESMQAAAIDALKKEVYSFVLTNSMDKNPYVKSERFNLKMSKAPVTVDFTYGSSIPNSTLNNHFNLELENTSNATIIDSFDVGELQKVLKLDEKNNEITIERDIKLESKNHKMVIFLNISIDRYDYSR